MRLCTFVLLILASCLASHARAQTRPAEQWQVSVVTFGPGEVIYERYGHVAIRLLNEAAGIDVMYDYGNFSFDDPNFLVRFLKGDLLYWMQGKYTAETMADYIDRQDRTVIEQVLNLTPEQNFRLRRLIAEQDNEEHRYYLYDFFKDNCATRVRDVVNDAIGNALRERAEREMTTHSYRWHNRRLVAVGPLNTVLAALMDIAFGPRNDRPLSRWDAAFLPVELATELDATRIADGQGGTVPLVRERRVLNTTTTPANIEPADAFNPAYLMLPVGLLGAAALAGLGIVWPLGFKLGTTLWALVELLGALFILALILFTRQWVLSWNENLLQFTVLALPVLVAAWSRRLRGKLQWATTAALGLSLLGALVTILPLTPQHNAAAVLLALPMHAAIFFGVRRLARRDAQRAATMADLSLQGCAV